MILDLVSSIYFVIFNKGGAEEPPFGGLAMGTMYVVKACFDRRMIELRHYTNNGKRIFQFN